MLLTLSLSKGEETISGLDRVQRVMGEDEQGPPIRAAEQKLQRPIGHVDAADLFA